MLVHLRMTVPDDLSSDIEKILVEDDRVTNVVVFRGASVQPEGDAIEADVAREAASDVIDTLCRTGLPERGGLAFSDVDGSRFAGAAAVGRAAPGDPDDAVIWNSVVDRARDGSRPSATYLVFLVLATLLASIAVITDSAVLVVGAMVVGPEFATIAATCVALVFGDMRTAVRSMVRLVASFALAISVVTVLALLARGVDLVVPEMVTRPRPQTSFIWHPDRWSFIVALVAGAAGVLAMTTAKSAAMVGVFISVTTVPAAGNLALGLALGAPDEIVGSATQLAVNVTGMLLAGVLTVWLQRVFRPAPRR